MLHGDSQDVDNMIIDYVDDFSQFVYRLIPIPKYLQYDKFQTGKVKKSLQKRRGIKAEKFKSGLYVKESDFIEKFVNFEDLHDEERECYAELVHHIQNAQPKIDFETEFVLILHLGIPSAAMVDIEGSFKTAKTVSEFEYWDTTTRQWRHNSKTLHLDVKYSQWNKWNRFNSFIWCIVINKKSNIHAVNVGSVHTVIRFTK